MKIYKVIFRHKYYNTNKKQTMKRLVCRLEQGTDIYEIISRIFDILKDYENSELLGIVETGIKQY